MKRIYRCLILVIGLSVLSSLALVAQEQSKSEAKLAYRKVVSDRADKIVMTLGIADSAKAKKVSDIIAQQYIDLNEIHDSRNASVKKLKSLPTENKAVVDSTIKKLEVRSAKKITKLHFKFIVKLSKNLSSDQVVMVKDGLTYKVLPITYKGYMEMLPNLSIDQKNQILSYLTEARELAMDAESSEKKHAIFGKYKGRINNYLSAAGIDMNKASKEWQMRIKEAASKK
jgi:hypothetical protein